MMVSIGVIGCGYWGPNLIRNFAQIRTCQVVAVADRDEERLEPIRRLYPAVRSVRSAEELLNMNEIDAVAIATPIETHFPLAKEALRRGKHVWVEKPLAETVQHSEELVAMADERRKVLMVDHTFIYTGAVRKIREIIDAGELGDLYYYDAVRINLGLFQRDLNVLWDLAPHDLSIMTYLIDKEPVSVSAVGSAPVRWGGWRRESIAYITVGYGDGMLAHMHVNWLSPVKIRRILIGGSRKVVVYDHLDPDNQVKIFDKGVEAITDQARRQMLVQYRTGDMHAPKIDQTEALEVACKHFLDCVHTGRTPLTDGRAGLKVVQLLEAAQRSLESRTTQTLAAAAPLSR
jgi:predicted dehydrogenase